MKWSRGMEDLKGFGRFAAIIRVLVKHGMGDVVDRLFGRGGGKPKGPHDEELLFAGGFPSPRRLRLVLEELGPSFIKLGQLMSTRADLFPPEYILEFEKLQDQVPPVAYADIEGVIERELKQPLSQLFADFDTESLAAASVAQVHRAGLFSGEEVAVKLIRPGIHKKIRKDIRLMYTVAERIEKVFEAGRIVGVVNLVKEFERTIFRELDMLIEAGSMEKFAAHFKDGDELYIPGVYWGHTSKSVLVMEYIDGVKMDAVEAIRAMGIDPKEIAMIGLRSFSRQLMDFGFFHADPHPGNTLVLADGRVGLVDFGITGYLDEEMMMHVANLFLGYAEHDYNLVMDALKGAGLVHEDMPDLVDFRRDLKDISEPFYGRSLQNISVRDVYEQVMQLVLKYRIRLPRNLLLLLKTFIQTEALGKILGSDASLLEVTKPYAKRLLLQSYEARKILKNLDRELRDLGHTVKTMPKSIQTILRQTAEGRQRLTLHHSGFESLDTRIEKGINRLTVGLVISASLVAAALVLNSTQRLADITVNLFGVKTIPLTALFGLTGYAVATILGLWLILNIFRSGKL
ncbi:MAG TPA: protein UbiB [Syntrophobacteraceae bacterium]|nr:protein UbiB [Syntrophobacteraceae bacterium]